MTKAESGKSFRLPVVNPTSPVVVEAPLRPGAEPASPTQLQPHVELAPKHDFAGKFRHPELIDRLKDYVQHQAEARRILEKGGDPPPGSALPDAAPVSINLDLTTGCNYACDHCVDMDILNKPFQYEHEKLVSSLRLMAERGLRSVIVIGGGEPTLYRKFEEIIRFMKSLDLRVSIVSNGSGQKKIAQIADCLGAEDWVRLSLDSGTDPTFQAMHKPRRKIRLEEICESVPGIKRINDRFQLGFSFIITWKGAFINDTNIVENLDEIVPAAMLARTNEFDYISFKPFLTRAPENNAEIVDLYDDQSNFDRVLERIRRHLDEAKRLETDRFRVLESTNLRVLENGSYRQFMEQPRQCHMQFFRQVLSPLGLYNCPVYRNQPHGKISDKDGYADGDRFRESVESTGGLLRTFDASTQCRQVTCLYNHVNWWIEDLVRHPEKLDEIEADRGREPDYFL